MPGSGGSGGPVMENAKGSSEVAMSTASTKRVAQLSDTRAHGQHKARGYGLREFKGERRNIPSDVKVV
jgi:hypothetical protein